jgi:hypothetical protein
MNDGAKSHRSLQMDFELIPHMVLSWEDERVVYFGKCAA